MHGEGWDGDDAVLDRMPVKSTLDAAPDLVEGRTTVLRGRAWSGEATVRAGRGQRRRGPDLARGHPDRPQRAVVLGRLGAALGAPPRAGDHELWVRATDSLGRSSAGGGAGQRRRLLLLRRRPHTRHGGAGPRQPHVRSVGSAGPGRVSASRVSAIAVRSSGSGCARPGRSGTRPAGSGWWSAGRARGSRRCAAPRPRRTSW